MLLQEGHVPCGVHCQVLDVLAAPYKSHWSSSCTSVEETAYSRVFLQMPEEAERMVLFLTSALSHVEGRG